MFGLRRPHKRTVNAARCLAIAQWAENNPGKHNQSHYFSREYEGMTVGEIRDLEAQNSDRLKGATVCLAGRAIIEYAPSRTYIDSIYGVRRHPRSGKRFSSLDMAAGILGLSGVQAQVFYRSREQAVPYLRGLGEEAQSS